ncbi:MAG: PEP-CTERM sorting domain-containing protein [Planctomycetaceae bacterium]|nr:PEP-CTERM sorting domain-containing protein [Planctomycetaceae bacterium]
MKNKVVLVGVGLLLALFNSAAYSAYVTSQTWTFDDADNPALPEISANLYGTAEAAITVTGVACGAEPGWYPTFLGRNGVWASEETTATLWIPNSQVLNPYKDVWLTMGFRADLTKTDAEVIATVPTATNIEVLGWTIDPTYDQWGYTDGWYVLNAHWRIYPNPASETIFIKIHDSGADIDYITVSTECIPEPATVGLLTLGVLGLVRRK